MHAIQSPSPQQLFPQSKKKKEHEVELGERLHEQETINQRLLESATNPLEQDQFTILPEDLHLGPRIGAVNCKNLLDWWKQPGSRFCQGR